MAPSRMSQVPAKIRTTPAHRSWPKATRDAATNVRTRPTTVTWLGVNGTRPMAAIRASARRRTHASNRVVNIAHLGLCRLSSRCASCILVSLNHPRSDCLPCVAPRFLVSVGAHAAPQLSVPGKDDQGGTELSPPLGPDRQAVAPGLEDRHVAGHLGGHHRQS